MDLKRTITLAGAALLALACCAPAIAGTAPAGSVKENSEGEMSYHESGVGGADIPMHVVGGVLGNQVAHGVRAELYVLQAEHPEQLKPDAPNHLFTVVLKDEASGKVMAVPELTLGYVNPQGKGSSAARAFQGMYRAGLRLPAPGAYEITVAFQTAAGASSLRFPYRYDAAAEGAGGHHHPGHSQNASPGRLMPVALQQTDTRLSRSELRAPTPAVELLDSNGQRVALRALLDEPGPVLVNFIFTSCQSVCPLMSESFARLQRDLGADAAKVRLISISIDPEFDRPAVLHTYAQRLHAGPQWHFLTGTPADISRVQEAFGTLQPNKMDHAAVVLLRTAPDRPWTRLEGLASAADLMREYHALNP